MGEYTPKQRPGKTHKQSATKNISSQESSFHMKSLASQSRIVASNPSAKDPKNANWISDFLHDGRCQLFGSGLRFHPQKSSKQPTISFFFFEFVFFHLEISCSEKRITPRSLGRKRCLNLSERWIAADASALRESPDPSLPGSWISSLAWFSSFQEWSITHFQQKASLDWTFPTRKCNRNATEMGEKACWFLQDVLASLSTQSSHL